MEDAMTPAELEERKGRIREALAGRSAGDGAVQEIYKEKAASYWDRFYKRNGARFFKDRHYLDAAFPELAHKDGGGGTPAEPRKSGFVMVEVGCGVGNSILPLLDANPNLAIYGVDFARTAIDTLRRDERYRK
jgi:tRNA G46 methylase TrmB